jgi:hypothetical protein
MSIGRGPRLAWVALYAALVVLPLAVAAALDPFEAPRLSLVEFAVAIGFLAKTLAVRLRPVGHGGFHYHDCARCHTVERLTAVLRDSPDQAATRQTWRALLAHHGAGSEMDDQLVIAFLFNAPVTSP